MKTGTPGTLDLSRWHPRLFRGGYLIAAIMLHFVLFLLLASWVVFQPPGDSPEPSFSAAKIPPLPPPPPAPPSAAGGQAANPLEPDIAVTPPPEASAIMATTSPDSFVIPSMKLPRANLSISQKPAMGSDLSGAASPGDFLNAGANPFGSMEGTGTGYFEGYLYDFKQSPERQPVKMSPKLYHAKIAQFIASNWDASVLEPYYKHPKPLFTSAIFIPTLNAGDGPKAFGVEHEIRPNMYAIWYHVTVKPPEPDTYRFVGIADDILVVAVNGKTVLDGSLATVSPEVRNRQTIYSTVDFKATCRPDKVLRVGVPFQVKPGESVKLDVLIGEEPGGRSNYFLYIQRDGAHYTKQSNGAPLLPVFQIGANPVKPAGKPMTYPPFSPVAEPWEGGAD